ncbi:ADP-dependent glucokinase/phosphofructokinase [Neobacillus sp. C211]|uniref:ADP-dependent glucokinase/phosphofructokinase n=1 Tax=unclassified Neobacillus TaxID=2675272 RepID=UPI00397A34BC
MTTIATGFTANIDLLAKITPEFYNEIRGNADKTPKSVIDTWDEFCTVIDWNIKRGSGAEYIVSNQEILARLEKKLDWTKAIGGTGLQAGCAASCAGYRALVNIPIQSNELSDLVSEHQELILLSDLEGDVPRHYIVEYEHGDSSNRIIFRKQDEFPSDIIAKRFLERLEINQDDISWLLISGYNAFDRSEDIDLFLQNTVTILASLGPRKPKVHLELASIWSMDEQWKIIRTLGGYVDSIGVNEDEYQELIGGNKPLLSYDDADLLNTINDACEYLSVANFILHTKQFSLIKSDLYDTSHWRKALENGNLMAFSRAVKGEICDQKMMKQVSLRSSLHPRGERLQKLTMGQKDITIIPAFRGETVSTIGLGDTFTAGLLAEAPVEFLPMSKLRL